MKAKKPVILFFLVCFITVLVMGSVSASDTYVNGSVTASGTGDSWATAYKTIQEGLTGVTDGNTVYIAADTYTGTGNKGITIDKSITIQGAGQDQTTIDCQGSGRAFTVNTGKTVTIKDLTVKNGYLDPDMGAAIRNDEGYLTVERCTFKDNTAHNSLGGAISSYKGTLTVKNCLFDHNIAHSALWGEGGAIWNREGSVTILKSEFINNEAFYGGAIKNRDSIGSMTITGCTFTGNKALSLDAQNGGYGGVIDNNAILNIADCVFTGNNAGKQGGAIYNDATLIITGSTFDKNTANKGGAISMSAYGSYEIIGNQILNNIGGGIYIEGYKGGGTILAQNGVKHLINFNRFYGNTPYGIYYNETINTNAVTAAEIPAFINTKYNWWGNNNGPNSEGADKTNLLPANYAPWIIMKFNPAQVSLKGGETTTIIANFLYDNIEGYHEPANGHIPDGTPVLFTTTLGQVGSQQVTKYTVNGVATAILRAWDEFGNPVKGIAYITATTDVQTLSSSVTMIPIANAGSNTVGMQETGIPIIGLILAVLALFGGLVTSKR